MVVWKAQIDREITFQSGLNILEVLWYIQVQGRAADINWEIPDAAARRCRPNFNGCTNDMSII